MIIFRYLTRELLTALFAISAILLLIFLSNQFTRFLSQAATGKFAGAILLRLIAIEIPHLLSVLLPLSLFLAILLIYGRMYADNEMTILTVCGVSRAKLTLLTLPTTFIVFILVCFLSLWLNPKLLMYRDTLLAQSGTAAQLETTLPGRFQEASGGQRIFYVESIASDHQRMRNLFMAQLANDSTKDNPDWIIVTAKDGYQVVYPTTGDRFFVATNGRRYEGIPGQNDFKVIQFGKYGIRIESHVADVSAQEETLSTTALFHATKDKHLAASELQWRLSMPLSALLLTLLAVPLSRVKPRFGRYAQLLPAILVYILYANLLLVGRNWIEQNMISMHIGLWWIHALLLLLIIVIWLWQTGWQTLRTLITQRRQIIL